MNVFLRSWKRLSAGAATAALAVLLAPAAAAQCPTPAACVPGRASNGSAPAFGMGIFNVSLGTASNPTAGFNNSTAGQADGYVDYGCATPAVQATLLVGQSYRLSVTTNQGIGENVRAWIDYNNDGQFIGTNELVMTSNNAMMHVAAFIPPSSATFNTPLRMRVSADYSQVQPPPTSCSTPQYSQVEDYAVTIVANANPPVAAFTTSGAITCTGCVQFTDASQNVPTSWLWDFGDNTTSTQQNPNHCYTAPGTYTVTLTATNAAGTSAPAGTNITYNNQVPVAAACTPPTLGYCCNYGVTRFRLGTIDNTSLDGRAGYQDFTCAQRTDLILGDVHPINITLGNTSTNQDTRVYLDGDNNGIFTAAELVFQALAPNAPTGVLNLPGSAQTNVPLRLRIVSDAGGNNPQPCTSPASGQIEDYTVVLRPNTNPPTAAFTSNYVPGGCVNPIQFTDQSTGAPSSWLWDFGDGSTSTLQNPTHMYAATGTYTVTLTATNAVGPNTVTRTNYLSITVPCLVYCPSNGVGPSPGGNPQPSPFWISTVSVANAQPAFSYNGGGTPNSVGGYGNHTAFPISVGPGGPVNLVVVSNLNFAHRVTVWVDYSRDGTFDLSEVVSNGVTPAGPTASTYNGTFQLPATVAGQSLRMRIQCLLSNALPNACATNIQNAEVEDYTLLVRPLGLRDARALPALTLYPNPTLDGRVQLSLPDAAAAGSYSVSVENLLGARLLHTTLRLGPAADAALDLSGLAKGIYVLRLRDAQGRTALRRVVRE